MPPPAFNHKPLALGVMLLAMVAVGCMKSPVGSADSSHPSPADLPKPPEWNVLRAPRPQDRPILVISWTQHAKIRGQKARALQAVGESLTVDRFGNAIRDYHFPFATQGNLVTRFQHPPDPKRILGFLNGLPPSAQVQNSKDALFVSFEDNGSWITRVYNWDHAPEALARMYSFMTADSAAASTQPPWMSVSF